MPVDLQLSSEGTDKQKYYSEVCDVLEPQIDKLRALMAFQVSTSSCRAALTSRFVQALVNVLWRVDVRAYKECLCPLTCRRRL